jgi:hypothetical protein
MNAFMGSVHEVRDSTGWSRPPRRRSGCQPQDESVEMALMCGTRHALRPLDSTAEPIRCDFGVKGELASRPSLSYNPLAPRRPCPEPDAV